MKPSTPHTIRRLLLPLLIGLAGGAAAAVILRWGEVGLARLQVAASDRLMLLDSGPQLGRRDPLEDIVLVLLDEASAKRLGGLPSPDQDLQLYRRLLDHGALSVADTRMMAIGTPEQWAESEPLVRQMAELAGRGLLRDIWVAQPPSELDYLEPLSSHNVLNMHVNPQAFFESRFYPLLTIDNFGVGEAMPLTLARRMLGLPAPGPEEVAAAAARCGIPLGQQPAAAPAGPYRLAGLEVRWTPVPSKSTLVPTAGYWISYAAPPAEYGRLSYAEVLDGEAPLQQLEGKTVLVGYSADVDPSSDTFQVPTADRLASAAEVVASAVQTLVGGRMMAPAPTPIALAAALLTCLLVSLTAAAARPAWAAAGVLALLLSYVAAAAAAYRADWMADFVVVPALAGLSAVASGSYRYWTEVRWRTRVVDLFGRYVPRAVVSQLVLKPDAEALAVGGVTREVTVLFADVRGFTSFSEDRPPEEVLRRLNQLLQVMVDCTFQFEGTVDKFIGDAILVLFNAPLEQPDHAERAVRTAWSIQQRLRDQPDDLTIGIGIHRGEAVVGTIGTPERMEYTAIGNTVNVASRLCDSAGPGEIVVSQSVAERTDAFRLQPREPITPKGLGKPLQIRLVTGPAEDGPADGQKMTE